MVGKDVTDQIRNIPPPRKRKVSKDDAKEKKCKWMDGKRIWNGNQK